jgi:TFIIF-interacting CTD phosphatase-like protein
MLETVILDIDECLVSMFTTRVNWKLYNTLRDPKHVKKRGDVFSITVGNEKFWGVKRPHLDEFLDFCFKTFKRVIVWSAGTSDYVEAVVNHIFRDSKTPHLVLTRSHIIYEFDWFYTKPLEVAFEHINIGLPSGDIADKTNTVLIDNQYSNALYDPHNIIHIPEFALQQKLEDIYKEDTHLLTIMEWLDHIDNNAKDIRDVCKKNIFK